MQIFEQHTHKIYPRPENVCRSIQIGYRHDSAGVYASAVAEWHEEK